MGISAGGPRNGARAPAGRPHFHESEHQLNRDQMLEGLHRERSRAPQERHKEIDEEIARVEKLPAPERPADDGDMTARTDPNVEYLRGLEKERSRAAQARHAEIDAEIRRVRAELRSAGVSRPDAAPDGDAEQALAERGRPARRGRARGADGADTESEED